MDWTSPVPLSADDDTGTTWQVRRAWPEKTPGRYVLEVLTPGTARRPGSPPASRALQTHPAGRSEAARLAGGSAAGGTHLVSALRSGGRPGGGPLHKDLPARPRRRACRALRTNGHPAGPRHLHNPQNPFSEIPGRHRFQRHPGTDSVRSWVPGRPRSPMKRSPARGRNGRAPGWRN